MFVRKIFFIFSFCVLLLDFVHGQEKKTDTTIYSLNNITSLPQFRGGTSAWNQYLANQINMDRIGELDSATYAQYGGVQKVIIEFVVNEDGRVSNLQIKNPQQVLPEFIAELERVFKNVPAWTPARKDEKAVKSRFRQVIQFNLLD